MVNWMAPGWSMWKTAGNMGTCSERHSSWGSQADGKAGGGNGDKDRGKRDSRGWRGERPRAGLATLCLGPRNSIDTSSVAHSLCLQEGRVRTAKALPALLEKENFAAKEPPKSLLTPPSPGHQHRARARRQERPIGTESTGIKKPLAWPSPSPLSSALLGWQVEE